MGYRAKAPVVKVSIGAADGNRVARIIREGTAVPDGVAQSQLDALEARGMIEKVIVVAVEDVTFDGPPAKNAGKDVWEAYALSRGFTDGDLAGLKKPELVELATNGTPGLPTVPVVVPVVDPVVDPDGGDPAGLVDA